MTAGAGVRVVESVGSGGDPIIIGARLVETADGVEEATGGNAVGIHGVGSIKRTTGAIEIMPSLALATLRCVCIKNIAIAP